MRFFLPWLTTQLDAKGRSPGVACSVLLIYFFVGQHLRLYASKTLTTDEVEKWCHARTYEFSEVPREADQLTVDKVRREMDRLQRTDGHLEHWSNWCGPMIWDFLVWNAYTCNEALVNRAVMAAATMMQTHTGLRKQYPTKDFTTDTPIEFLRAHMGCVVWGENDGL